ncbi:MAG TPA: hypothetical protein VNK43_02965 [Gemmatimonadales bacterium]|nr:hypothetical protein [Gemmatimonadales bacterium]
MGGSGTVVLRAGRSPGVLSLPVGIASAQESTDSVVLDSALVPPSLAGELVDRLPVDRVEQALVTLPGVGTDNRGQLHLRGGDPEDAVLYVDRIPVAPGRRGLPVFGGGLDPRQSRLGLGTNAPARAELRIGPPSPSAALGNGQGGALLLETQPAPDRLSAGLSRSTTG